MGLLDKLKNKLGSVTAPGTSAVPGMLYAPLAGTLVPIEEIPDDVISQGILGQGCGIQPDNGKVFSPVDGTVSGIAQTLHAVGVTTAEGAELLIHVGVDTVEMNGEGFCMAVKAGQQVVCGQLLLTFDPAAIERAGHPIVTTFVVTNADEFAEVTVTTGLHVAAGQEIGFVRK